MKKIFISIILISFFGPSTLLAHGSHGTGFIAGFTHPIFGLDHLLAILGTTLLGYTLLKEKQWIPSLAFIITMIIGAIMGINAEAFNLTEWMIALSVLATGILLAFNPQFPATILLLLSTLFGFFHGHAHGTEMPDTSNIPLFILGFILGASLIAISGWGITKILKKEPLHIHLLGALIAGMGLMMLIG